MGFPPSDSSKKSRHAEIPTDKGDSQGKVVVLSSWRKARHPGDIEILNRPAPGHNPGDSWPYTPDAA